MASGLGSLLVRAAVVSLLLFWPSRQGWAALRPLECHSLGEVSDSFRSTQDKKLLSRAEAFVDRESPAAEKAACWMWIADQYRDLGDYEAERLYQEALEQAPDNPELLETVARYYRNYRGSRGLFAESEVYYLRAETALEQALSSEPETKASRTFASDLRERILRGRIELYKREGLGLLVPGAPGARFGAYLGAEVDDGGFSFAHNDLATPTRTLLNLDHSFPPRDILRDRDRRRSRSRPRFRLGTKPYLDVAWTRTVETNTFASQSLPVFFSDLDVDELEVGVEDTAGSSVGDVFWRVDYRTGRFDPEGPTEEDFRRITAATTLTRNFGRVKADFTLLGSDAAIDLSPGNGRDDDRLFAASLRLLQFRDPDTAAERLINPQGYEYALGYVSRRREFGPDVLLLQDTYFGSLKLTELMRHTDLDLVGNYFQNEVRGRTGEDSSDIELNAIFTLRLIDRINKLYPYQADRSIGLAQWAATLRLVNDTSTRSLKSFESRGVVLGSFVELFSGPLNWTTLILEGDYEIRDYHRLGVTDRLSRFSLRLGF